MTDTQGRRVDWTPGNGCGDMLPGDYCKVPIEIPPARKDGQHTWYIRDPGGKIGRLSTHTVTEHDDGTISVQPSILDPTPGGWHGYLTAGIWTDC